jgi:two-component system, sensor histidine kinase
VVDDNRDAADSLTMILEPLWAEVRVAYAGSEALDTLAHYDAMVVLDIGMDGYEVAIRARGQGRRRILVALTGWGREADRMRALQAGLDHPHRKTGGESSARLDSRTLANVFALRDKSPDAVGGPY